MNHIKEMAQLIETVAEEFEKINCALAEKEKGLALNAKMLARQTDLAREAEIKLAELREKVRRWEKAKTVHNNLRLSSNRFNLHKALAELEEAEAELRAAVEKPE